MNPLIEFALFALALPVGICWLLHGGEILGGFLGLAGFMTFVIRNS